MNDKNDAIIRKLEDRGFFPGDFELFIDDDGIPEIGDPSDGAAIAVHGDLPSDLLDELVSINVLQVDDYGPGAGPNWRQFAERWLGVTPGL